MFEQIKLHNLLGHSFRRHLKTHIKNANNVTVPFLWLKKTSICGWPNILPCRCSEEIWLNRQTCEFDMNANIFKLESHKMQKGESLETKTKYFWDFFGTKLFSKNDSKTFLVQICFETDFRTYTQFIWIQTLNLWTSALSWMCYSF